MSQCFSPSSAFTTTAANHPRRNCDLLMALLEMCVSMLCRLMAGLMQNQLLHTPVQQFGDVEHVLGRARDLVNPSELLQLFA